MSEYRITTEPAEEPVTLAEARRHCRVFVEDADEDAYIQALVVAAREWVEAAVCRAFVTRTVEVRLDRFPSECGGLTYVGRFPVFHTGDDRIELLYPPLQSVTSIVYGADSITLDPSEYEVTPGTPGVVRPVGSWPTTEGPIIITFQAGYGLAADVPQRAKLALLMLVAQWYEARQPIATGTIVAQIPFTVNALLASLRYGQYP